MSLTREWDRASRGARMRLLHRIVDECDNMSAAQLEKRLGPAAPSLLLVRVSGYLRLNYRNVPAAPLLAPLRAICLLVGAAPAKHLLAEFVESGGVPVLVELLTLDELPRAEMEVTLTLLATVAASGAQYKQLICAKGGVAALERLVGAEFPHENIRQAAASLLQLLSAAGPSAAAEVRRALLRLCECAVSAAQLLACANLRMLLTPTLSPEEMDEAYAARLLVLLRSFNTRVLFEAQRLFEALAACPPLELPVLRELVRCIRQQPLAAGSVDFDLPPPHQQAAVLRTLGRTLSAMEPGRRDALCVKLRVVPCVCLLLLAESNDCRVSSAQALGLLGEEDGAPRVDMEQLLGLDLLECVLATCKPGAETMRELSAAESARLRDKLCDVLSEDGTPLVTRLTSADVAEHAEAAEQHGDEEIGAANQRASSLSLISVV